MANYSEFKKPVAVVSIVLAILSIALSVVFYIKSIKERQVSYYITETPSLIFDSKISSPIIKILEKDTIPIKDNVYLLTGTIWNSGDLTISKSDVRLPIIISLLNSNRILDIKIVKEKDSRTANFLLTKVDDKSYQVNWDYFDPGYGFSFQIIYAGDIDPKFKLDGVILDIANFQQKKNLETKKISKYYFLIFLPIAFVFSMVAHYTIDSKKPYTSNWTSVPILIFGLIMILLNIWLVINQKVELPI